jgi:hypothetical protein
MRKLYDDINKEIDCIEEQGVSSSNLDVLFKLVDIAKDLIELDEKTNWEEEDMRYDRRYDVEPYYQGGRYNGDRRYMDSGSGSGYRGSSRMYDERYGHLDQRFYDRLDRITEALEDYMYGKDRYHDNGGVERMKEGLDKVMYGVCTLVETLMDFAETPEEKEIVRKHVDKMRDV